MTGAAGRVGGCVAAGLQQSGHDVRVHDVVDVPGTQQSYATSLRPWAAHATDLDPH